MRSTFLHLAKRLLLAATCLMLPAFALASSEGSHLTITPDNIVMDAKYDGLTLKVTGTVPADSSVIVRLTGTPGELHMREKGKVFGLLWMNVGKVTLHNVPNTCLVSASAPFEQMGTAAAPFRLQALATAIGIERQGGDQSIDIPRELLLLKTKEGLYRESAQGVTLSPNQGDTRAFAAEIPVPSSLTPGAYQVEAIAVRNNAVASRATSIVTAELTGFPKWLSELAYQESLLYGVMATVVAIFSGLAIGLVFQSKGAH